MFSEYATTPARQTELKQPTPPGRALLLGLFAAAALNPLNSTMIAAVLPRVGDSFAVAPGTLTVWLVTSYLLVNTTSQSPAGRAGDLWGPARALALGLGAFAVGTGLALWASSLAMLAVARVTMALGGALTIPAVASTLRRALPQDRRARAFGVFGAVMGLSAAAGPVLAGLISAHLGWHAIFALNLPLLVGAGLLLRRGGLPGPTPTPGSPGFDRLGTVLLGLGLAGIVLGLRDPHHISLPLSAGGLLTLAAFLWWERRVDHPLIDPGLFRLRVFAAGSLVIATQNLAIYALLFLVPFLPSVSPDATGVVLLSMLLALMVGAPLGGVLSERAGIRAVVLAGSGLAGLGVLGLLTLTPDVLVIAMGLAAVGAGVGLSSAPAQAAALSAVDEDRSGVAAGVMSTLRYLGGVAGVAVVTGLLSTGQPTSMSQVRPGFLLLLAVLLVAALAGLALPGPVPTHPRRAS